MTRRYRVRLVPEAIDDLESVFRYIASRSGFAVAQRFKDKLRDACAALDTWPERGTRREELGRNLRTIGVERRATILFEVDHGSEEVIVHAVLYGGRDIEAIVKKRL